MSRTSQFALLVPCLAALLLFATPSPGRQPDEKRPFFDARQGRTESAGPRSQSAEAKTVDEVRIGYFGPGDADHPTGGEIWRAAQLAVERANTEGGCRGRPFRLLPAWSENPWGTGIADLARLVYRDQVWAIVGGIDGPSTHLAEQVVAKAGLTLISPVSTDKTANLANVPWIFSLAPGDHLSVEPLAEEIKRLGAAGDLVLLSADDHDSRMFTTEMKRAFLKREIGLRRQIEFQRGAKQSAALARQVLEIGPATVVVSADPGDSARLVAALRTAGYLGKIFGGPAMGHREFLVRAGDAAEGVVFPLLFDASSESAACIEFREAYRRKYERQPDYTAAHTYDAVRLLVAAIRTAGLDRAGIRDALAGLSPWTGATGLVRFDGLGSNTRCPPLGTIGNGLETRLGATARSRKTIPRDQPGSETPVTQK